MKKENRQWQKEYDSMLPCWKNLFSRLPLVARFIFIQFYSPYFLFAIRYYLCYALFMGLISLFLPYIQVALAVLLSIGILVQQTAAGLGGALGDNFSSGFHTRRGFEKFTFNATIVLAVAFAISAFLALIIK